MQIFNFEKLILDSIETFINVLKISHVENLKTYEYLKKDVISLYIFLFYQK